MSSTDHSSPAALSDQQVIDTMLQIVGAASDHAPLALLKQYEQAFPGLPRERLLSCASKTSTLLLETLLRK